MTERILELFLKLLLYVLHRTEQLYQNLVSGLYTAVISKLKSNIFPLFSPNLVWLSKHSAERMQHVNRASTPAKGNQSLREADGKRFLKRCDYRSSKQLQSCLQWWGQVCIFLEILRKEIYPKDLFIHGFLRESPSIGALVGNKGLRVRTASQLLSFLGSQGYTVQAGSSIYTFQCKLFYICLSVYILQ